MTNGVMSNCGRSSVFLRNERKTSYLSDDINRYIQNVSDVWPTSVEDQPAETFYIFLLYSHAEQLFFSIL